MSEQADPDQYDLSLRTASQTELVGAMMIRAQVIEEIMREAIAHETGLNSPREVDERWTFGRLAKEFRKLFPDEEDLCEWLDISKTARNEAAHSSFLIGIFLSDVMKDYPDQDAVQRFSQKALRKDVEGVDSTLQRMMAFRASRYGHTLFTLSDG